MANCPKCNRYLLWAVCFNCKNTEPKNISIIKPVKLIKDKPVKSKPVISSDKEPKTGLPLYTKSQLNHKHWCDYHSIDKQTKCILFNGKYILHSDIIIWFKDHIS